jgi:transposase
MGSIFEGKRPKKPTEDDEAKTSKLYEEIGRLKIEVDWLKKKSEQISKM